MNQRICRDACLAAATAWLSACGGGGGGSGGAASTSTNPPASTVSGASPTVTFLPQTIVANATPAVGAVQASTNVAITGAKDSLWVALGSTLHGVAIASVAGQTLDALQIDVTFKEAGALPDGTYTDTVTFEVCTDDQCKNQISGSPFSVPVTFTVTGSSATTAPTGLSAPTGFLAHDVVDAAMSRPLGLVVMASTQPANTLQLVDVATGTERAVALSRAPTSIALSPDGRHVAVGHDGLVSLVDLTAAQPVPREVAVPATVWDLVLDDDDIVQAFPAASQWVNIYTVDMTAGTAVASAGTVYEKTRARLHPGGGRMYLLDTEVSPEVPQRYDLAGGVPSFAARSPDWGTWAECGNFWFSESGDRMFSACGSISSSDADPGQDMLHEGQLPLTAQSGYYWSIVAWLDDASVTHELAVLDAGQCGATGGQDCNTLLRLIDDRDDTNRAAYWMPPVYRDGAYRVQHGTWVFHAADGSLRVITRLAGVTDATHAWTLDQPRANGVGILSAPRALAARRVAAQ